MGSNNYYSDNNNEYSNMCNNNMNHENNCHNDDESNNHHERECCGKRFNNRPTDKKVRKALEAFEKQLFNTDEAIECLNKVFNNLEDEIFEDRCCPSNRIKNILKSIQTEICDLEDDVRNIRDDFECLEQAL